jgi:serpin B
MFQRFSVLLFLPLALLWGQPDPIGQSTCDLAIDAYSNRPKLDENYLFSPLSASSCMSMVYTGANGSTAEEIGKALHLFLPQESIPSSFCNLQNRLIHSPNSNNDFTLHIAQGLWSQEGFLLLDDFVSSMQNNFKAMIESIHFDLTATKKINDWIAQKTNQKIQNLLASDDLDSSTKLVLANALYFSGAWHFPFEARCTEKAPYYLYPSIVKIVPMMNQQAKLPYYENEDLQAVLLPFQSSIAECEPACLLILGKKDTMPLQLTKENIDAILAQLNPRIVRLSVPKFTLEQKPDLDRLFRQLGVSLAFSSSADFSNMDGRIDLFLSKIVQKCFLSFDEKGVEAAAATASIMNVTTEYHPPTFLPVSFIADHPFELLLIEKNGRSCLMIGHIADPPQ